MLLIIFVVSEIDWQEVGRAIALVLTGAGAAWGALKKWAPRGEEETVAPPRAAIAPDLLPAVLEALTIAKDTSDDAISAVRSASLTAVETQRSLGVLIGALRDITERLEGIEARLRRVVSKGDRANPGQRS